MAVWRLHVWHHGNSGLLLGSSSYGEVAANEEAWWSIAVAVGAGCSGMYVSMLARHGESDLEAMVVVSARQSSLKDGGDHGVNSWYRCRQSQKAATSRMEMQCFEDFICFCVSVVERRYFF